MTTLKAVSREPSITRVFWFKMRDHKGKNNLLVCGEECGLKSPRQTHHVHVQTFKNPNKLGFNECLRGIGGGGVGAI